MMGLMDMAPYVYLQNVVSLYAMKCMVNTEDYQQSPTGRSSLAHGLQCLKLLLLELLKWKEITRD